jgi:hypothetical protein
VCSHVCLYLLEGDEAPPQSHVRRHHRLDQWKVAAEIDHGAET